MKSSKTIFVAVILLALVLFLLLPSVSWAMDDGSTAAYKARCAACHGADGLAQTPMAKKQSIPSFASSKLQKMTNASIEDFILNGGVEKKPSHTFASKGVSKSDAVKLAVYVKELGKKK